jgi:hypothetical protein
MAAPQYQARLKHEDAFGHAFENFILVRWKSPAFLSDLSSVESHLAISANLPVQREEMKLKRLWGAGASVNQWGNEVEHKAYGELDKFSLV